MGFGSGRAIQPTHLRLQQRRTGTQRTGELPPKRVRLLHSTGTWTGRDLGPGPGVPPAFLAEHLAAGATVSVHLVEDLEPVVHGLTQAFARALGAPHRVNAHCTPAGHTGLAPHSDSQEAFILQVGGAKDWEVYAPPVVLPAVGGPGQDADIQGQEPHLSETLETGDLLYLPQGFAHRARALPGAPSLHQPGHSPIGRRGGTHSVRAEPALGQPVESRSKAGAHGGQAGFLKTQSLGVDVHSSRMPAPKLHQLT